MDDEAHTQTDQSALHASRPEQNSVNRSTRGNNADSTAVPSDLWSAAYREAVDSFGDDIDVAILKGNSVAQLFKKLEDIDREATQESAFLRGVAYLQKIQVPLERFKLVLDIASPLSNIDPAATAIFGVVKGVTAVSFFHLILELMGEYTVSLTSLNIDCYNLRKCRHRVCKADRRNARTNSLH